MAGEYMDSKNDLQPLSFSGSEAVRHLKDNLLPYFEKSGLNPYVTEDWKKGIFQLFGIQITGFPDLEEKNYVLLSNHISDFDGIILGLLHPKIKIIAKMDWAANGELMAFLRLHKYDIVGIYRDVEIAGLDEAQKKSAKEHNIRVNMECCKHLKDTSGPHHLLIFPQGTISDINKNSKERINPSFAKIASATNAGIINIFTEYPGTDGKTRIVGGEPYILSGRGTDCRQAWIDDMINLQNQLRDVRSPVLSEKHSQNNNPSEPFF